MNKFIKEQLQKIRVPMSEWNEDTEVIHFYSTTTISQVDFQVGKLYRIKLENYILHEPPNFTLSTNWNKGVIPTSEILDARVINVQGKMIQVNAVGFNVNTNTQKTDTYSYLWLPKKSVTILGVYKEDIK